MRLLGFQEWEAANAEWLLEHYSGEEPWNGYLLEMYAQYEEMMWDKLGDELSLHLLSSEGLGPD